MPVCITQLYIPQNFDTLPLESPYDGFDYKNSTVSGDVLYVIFNVSCDNVYVNTTCTVLDASIGNVTVTVAGSPSITPVNSSTPVDVTFLCNDGDTVEIAFPLGNYVAENIFGQVKIAGEPVTPTPSASVTLSPTPSQTVTPSPTPSQTVTPSPTPSQTVTPSPTPSQTVTPSPTPSQTVTPSPTPSQTSTPTPSPSGSPFPTPVPGLWAWGNNWEGRLGNNNEQHQDVPILIDANSNDICSLSVSNSTYRGTESSAIIKKDNTLYVCGNSTLIDGNRDTKKSQLTQVKYFENWKKLSNSFGLKNDGTIWCWGPNDFGRIGRFGNWYYFEEPVQTRIAGSDWVDVSGGSHVLAIKKDGTLWGWGRGGSSELGDNFYTNAGIHSPVQIFNSNDWSKIEVGFFASYGIKKNGTLWAWGNNGRGQLGLNYIKSYVGSPQQVTTDSNWIQISSNKFATIAVKSNGTAWGWGNNSYGQLGDGTFVHRSSPCPVLGVGAWSKVLVGYTASCGIKKDGTLWTWGKNDFGILGNRNELNITNSPIQTAVKGDQWSDISIFRNIFATYGAIPTPGPTPTTTINLSPTPTPTPLATPIGGLYGWGANEWGVVGDAYAGYGSNRSYPILVSEGDAEWLSINCSAQAASAAIKKDNTLWTWGFWGYTGIYINRNFTPTIAVYGYENWKKFINKSTNSIGIKNDGTLWCVGNNSGGQCGDNSTVYRSYLVQEATFSKNWIDCGIGQNNCFAIKNDGSLWFWGGDRGSGIIDVNVASSPIQVGNDYDWSQISVGGIHQKAAIKKNGTLWVWGDNYYGQLGLNYGQVQYNDYVSMPTQVGTDNNWIYVHVGEYAYYHQGCGMYGIKNDGTAFSWGLNFFGNLGLNDVAPRSSPSQIIGNNWSKIVSSFGTVAGIKKDGTLWTWGANYEGCLGINKSIEPTSSPAQTIREGNQWVDVAGGNTILALYGTIPTPGPTPSPTSTQPTPSPSPSRSPTPTPSATTQGPTPTPTKSPTATPTFTPSPTPSPTFQYKDGQLFLWGKNDDGRLGDNTTIHKSYPVEVYGDGTTWDKISAGNAHFGAIKKDGYLFVWGNNNIGQLGNNQVLNISSPIQVGSSYEFWDSVSCGENFTSALKLAPSLTPLLNPSPTPTPSPSPTPSPTFTNSPTPSPSATPVEGGLLLMGSNYLGKLGDGTEINRSSPVQTIAGGSGWRIVSCAAGHVMAIKNDGTLWGWGFGPALGTNTFSTLFSSPVQTVAGGTDWLSIACGANFSIALKNDNSMWVWGGGGFGVLGNNTDISISSPIQVHAEYTWSSFDTGWLHSAAIRSDGTLWVWGTNSFGQLGNNDTLPTIGISSPIQVGTENNWNVVSCGYDFTGSIKTDGTLWMWGENEFGQLGDSTITNRSSPIQIGNDTNWSHLSCGMNHTAAIKTDGTLWCWGWNSLGQLGSGDTIDRSSPLQIGVENNWIFVACGDSASAIKKDGTLWIWGYNTVGQLGDNTVVDKSSPVQLSIGSNNWKYVSCALSSSTISTTNAAIKY